MKRNSSALRDLGTKPMAEAAFPKGPGCQSAGVHRRKHSGYCGKAQTKSLKAAVNALQAKFSNFSCLIKCLCTQWFLNPSISAFVPSFHDRLCFLLPPQKSEELSPLLPPKCTAIVFQMTLCTWAASPGSWYHLLHATWFWLDSGGTQLSEGNNMKSVCEMSQMH